MPLPHRPLGPAGNPRPPKPDLVPPYLPSPDLDYQEAFRCLASIQIEVQREGLTRELALRRGHARFALGDYLAAAFDAERATRLDPHCPEADFLRGQAFLALAAVKHGVAPGGLGMRLPTRALPARRHLLLTARNCFRRVLAHNRDDRQAQRALSAVQALLEDLRQARPRNPAPTPLLGSRQA